MTFASFLPCARRSLPLAIATLLLSTFFTDTWSAAEEPSRPNVLLIITDDQGYGDIGIHGNAMLKTPNLDAFARQGIRLTNFHTDPTCAETRAALMTGRYSVRSGVWHTIMGRSILRRDEKIMPQFFKEAGYATGAFGKWHLGDNYPYRPVDRGFDESLVHAGGGVGQTPDAWGNDYFDDTYLRNGQPEQQQGYCTDIWFRNAEQFIERHKDGPFFCYLATNAAHSPYRVDSKYSQPYVDQGVPQPMANFYGMIANVDENVGRLLARLDEWKLSNNTIVIFMTDNGTAEGVYYPPQPRNPNQGRNAKAASESDSPKWTGYNAGMRGQKASQYDGGHRVPCFIRWPQGEAGRFVRSGAQVGTLTTHFDLLPTLAEICRLTPPEGNKAWDGRSLTPLLTGCSAEQWPARTIFVHSQRVERPEKWRKTAVLTDDWRLVNGNELYESLERDPGQERDVSAQHPDVVAALRKEYDAWWADVSQGFDEYPWIVLGSEKANPVDLNCHDWHAPEPQVPWAQGGQRGVSVDPMSNGWWAVEVEQGGQYEVTLRTRPAGVSHPLAATRARVRLGEVEKAVDVPAGAEEVTLSLELQPGQSRLQTWLESEGKSRGAYYVRVRSIAP